MGGKRKVDAGRWTLELRRRGVLRLKILFFALSTERKLLGDREDTWGIFFLRFEPRLGGISEEKREERARFCE